MRPLKNLSEIVVIGGGIAGLTAARHAARLGRFVTLFEPTGMYGGLVATIGHVEGLPFPGEHSGQDLAIALLEDVKKVGVRVVEASVEKVEPGDTVTLTDQDGQVHHPEAVIVASGGTLRTLGVPGEAEFVGRGVSRCATCDGGFFKGKTVAVVGGGDGAVHEALVLARTSGKVVMVCRSPLSAKSEYVDRIDARENVTFLWDSEVEAILGEARVDRIRVRNVKTGAVHEEPVDGFFPYIGVVPNTGFLPPSVLAETGHVKTDGAFASADPRILAVGQVRAGYGGNLVEAMAEGVAAATAAVRLLNAA